MGKSDLLMKVFFSNPYVFADVFNFWLHDGAQLIRPENLREASGNLVSLTAKNIDELIDHIAASADDEKFELPDIEVNERMRDVLMHLICMEDGESVYALLGIEGQTNVDYAMAARALIYDAKQYEKQLKMIYDQHKAKGERGNTPGEFLWKFFKTDHLVPVITVVAYLGSDDWDGPRTLHSLFKVQNSAFVNHVADYNLNLIEPLRMNENEMFKFQTDMREVMLYMNSAKNKQKLLQLAKDGKLRKVDPITAHLINEVSKSKIQIKKGKVKIDMCEAIKGIREDALKEGIEQGIGQGIEQGIEQGHKKVALNMASAGMSVSVISQMTEESEETIQEWLSASTITVH